MTTKELYIRIIQEYENLDEFEKAKMFLEYYIKNVTNEHTVVVLETKPTSKLLHDSKKSYDPEIPYFKTNKELGISYGTFKRAYTFNSTEEFCNPENIQLHHIPDWKKQGFAQEYILQTTGIYKVLETKIREATTASNGLKTIIQNSKNLEGEIVDMVNKNFAKLFLKL